jgi:hypothetical protein
MEKEIKEKQDLGTQEVMSRARWHSEGAHTIVIALMKRKKSRITKELSICIKQGNMKTNTSLTSPTRVGGKGTSSSPIQELSRISSAAQISTAGFNEPDSVRGLETRGEVSTKKSYEYRGMTKEYDEPGETFVMGGDSSNEGSIVVGSELLKPNDGSITPNVASNEEENESVMNRRDSRDESTSSIVSEEGMSITGS